MTGEESVPRHLAGERSGPDRGSACHASYEVFWEPGLEQVAIILPGDCLGSGPYRPLAEQLLRNGVGALLLDYPTDLRRQTNESYVKAVAEAMEEVLEERSRAKPLRVHVVGHSRGALVAVAILQARRFSIDRTVLIAPLLPGACANASLDPDLLLEFAIKRLWGRSCRFSSQAFKKRFFSGEESNIAQVCYKKHLPFSWSLLDGSEHICVEPGTCSRMSVLIYRNDRVFTAQKLVAHVSSLRAGGMAGLRWRVLDGSHCQALCDPSPVIEELLER